MLTSWLFLLVAWAAVPAQTSTAGQTSTPGTESFSTRVLASGLENPWEMRWGPDGRIWVTERTGKRVVRVNPADGTKSTTLTISDVLQKHGQDGLLGMALHPDLLKNTSNQYVYLALTYDADPGPTETRRMAVRRYTYDARTEALGMPMELLTNLPAGNDHVSGRLVFGADQKLYLTIGDGGYNQLSLFCLPIHAQELPTAAEVTSKNWQHYEGKVLRLNLDGSIPADNPTLAGARSHVFTYGHRNAQGLIVAADGKIYASEHGPSIDDELNLIQAGKNYGWPYVAGFKDDQVYQYTNWSASAPEPCSSLKFTEIVAPASVPHQKESAWNDPNFMPPLRTFFTVGADHDFAAQKFATIAPSGIDLYTGTAIPGWANSVLITSLTRGTVYRVKLSPTGDSTVGPTLEYFKSRDRYRDVLVNPDGRTIYTAVDAGANLEHPGAIVAFTYQAGPAATR